MEDLSFAEKGGAILLRGSFPCGSREETFRTHTSGRSLGHSGTVLHDHPLWKNFPHDNYADWQFYPMMSKSRSMIQDGGMPEFTPLMELIPSFKLIRRKSLLSEFRVGEGRILMCGLRLTLSDPAGNWFRSEMIHYLNGRIFFPAPEWSADDLRIRIKRDYSGEKEISVDKGGRPEF